MLLRKCITLLSVCALVYSEDVIDSESNNVSTERYESHFEVIEEMLSDGDQEKGFVAMAAEESGSNPNATNFAAGFVDVDTDTEMTTIVDTKSPSDEEEIEIAKREVIEWIKNLDCDNSDLGPFKCSMVRQLVKNFLKHADAIDKGVISKISNRIKIFIKKLEDSNTPIDDVLKKIIQKYKRLL